MAETIRHAIFKLTGRVSTRDVTSQVLKSGEESYYADGEMAEWHAGSDPVPQAAWAEERTIGGSGTTSYDLAALNGAAMNGKKVIALKLVAPSANPGSLTVNPTGATNPLAGLGVDGKLYPGGMLGVTMNAGSTVIGPTSKVIKIDNDTASSATVRLLVLVGNAAP